MRRKRVLFLLHSLMCGGAEKQTVDLINHLDSSDFAVSLCCFAAKQDLIGDVRPENLEGIHCLEKKKKFDISSLKRLVKTIAKVQPEIIVSVNLKPSFYAYLVRLLSRGRFKIFPVMHTTVMRNRFEHFLTRFFYAPLTNRCERIIFVCRNQMQYWHDNFGINRRKSSYIYNGIDIDKFSNRLVSGGKAEIHRRYGIDEGHIVICICAGLRSEKRHVDLIDAVKVLLGKSLPVKLIIVGDGPERKAIEAHIQNRGMEKHVVMTGYQQDVRPFIAAADIVAIVSSAVETFSIAILEAMAMGKAIVASNIGGAPEQVIDGENGFIFPAGDVKKLAECLQRIIADGLADEMGMRSRTMVCEKFTLDQMVRRYKELLTGTKQWQ